jgi:hypothetical protein
MEPLEENFHMIQIESNTGFFPRLIWHGCSTYSGTGEDRVLCGFHDHLVGRAPCGLLGLVVPELLADARHCRLRTVLRVRGIWPIVHVTGRHGKPNDAWGRLRGRGGQPVQAIGWRHLFKKIPDSKCYCSFTCWPISKVQSRVLFRGPCVLCQDTHTTLCCLPSSLPSVVLQLEQNTCPLPFYPGQMRCALFTSVKDKYSLDSGCRKTKPPVLHPSKLPNRRGKKVILIRSLLKQYMVSQCGNT